MDNKDLPAVPAECSHMDGKISKAHQIGCVTAIYPGFSKREYIAAMCLQGILSFDGWRHDASGDVEHAIKYVDELLTQLNDKQGEGQ